MKTMTKPSKKAPAVLMSTPVSEAESDRRLRPVLDALYIQNWKQALKLVQQAIHKRPGWPAARALRACALMQSDRLVEAEKEITGIRADLDAGRVPLDEDCARKLHMYYLEMRREDCAGEVYEHAWKLDAANVQLAETSFCLYIRGSSFSSAQKIATKLHRFAAAKTQKYALWATAALWLGLTKAGRGSAGEVIPADGRMLKLACAMLSKVLDATPVTPSAEMVRFAVRVYKDGGDLQRANDLVSNPRLVMDEAEVLHIRTELPLSDDGRLSDHREVLVKYDADDWAHWLRYFEAVKHKPDWENIAMDFINECIAVEGESKRPKRGPSLAKLELLLRMERMEAMAESIVDYFARFGGKTVAAHDLRPYLYRISKTNISDSVFDEFSDVVQRKGQSHELSMSWLSIWFNRLDDNAEQLFSRYCKQLSQLSEPTDRQAGDDYLLLAAHKILPYPKCLVKDRYANKAAVLQAILILEAGLRSSPFNFHIKLLLMRLHIEIGGISRVAELWDSLEIKHLQLVTLMHIVLHPFFDAGHHETCRELLERVEALWCECDQEIPDCISKAFQVGSISAAVDFVLFRTRLVRSLALAQCVVVEALHEVAATAGELLGVKRALACLSSTPRFMTHELHSCSTLLNNNDLRCFGFWELQKYNPDDRLNIQSEVDFDTGPSCSPLELAVVITDLNSLKTLLCIAAGEECSKRSEPVDGPANNGHKRPSDTSHITEGVELPSHTKMRAQIANNLTEVKELLLQTAVTVSSATSEKGTSPGHSSQDILQTAQNISNELVTTVEQLVGIKPAVSNDSSAHDHNGTCETADDGNPQQYTGSFFSGQLRKCGRMAFDTLLVTSVALVSFSSILIRGKKKAKKSVVREDSEGPTFAQDFECGRQAILEYKQAILVVCSLIQTWIATCLENDLDWVSSVLPDGENVGDLVPYLQDTLPTVDLKEGYKIGNDLSRTNFSEGILAQICSSQAQSCRSILEALRGIISRLSMVDF